MISISMCMIVKNEQDILARCLDSYAGTYDELIIVDTGSTDNTKEIAAHYTDKIYDFEWINDFSAARNFAFSKAGCDRAVTLAGGFENGLVSKLCWQSAALFIRVADATTP